MNWRGGRTPNVERLERKGKVARLVEAASYSDRMVDRNGHVFDRGAPVRAAALDALTRLPPEAGDSASLFSLFEERLHDPSPQVVQAAVRALTADASAEGAWALVDLLAATGPHMTTDTRHAALDALRATACPGISERWSRRVIDQRDGDLNELDRQDLMALMDADGTADPRQRVFEVLVPHIVGTPDQNGVAQRAETILIWCMPARVDGLTELFSRHDVSAAVIRVAGQAGDLSVLNPLIGLLEHPSPATRAQAAEALGNLCDTAAVLPLMGATSDSEITVRRAAVRALDTLGSAGVTAALAVFAHTATFGPRPEDRELGGGPWSRTLARLTERAGAAGWTRRLRRSEGEPGAALAEVRGRYEALVAEPNPPQA